MFTHIFVFISCSRLRRLPVGGGIASGSRVRAPETHSILLLEISDCNLAHPPQATKAHSFYVLWLRLAHYAGSGYCLSPPYPLWLSEKAFLFLHMFTAWLSDLLQRNQPVLGHRSLRDVTRLGGALWLLLPLPHQALTTKFLTPSLTYWDKFNCDKL